MWRFLLALLKTNLFVTFFKKFRCNQCDNKYIFNDVFLAFSDVLENVTIVIKEDYHYPPIKKKNSIATFWIHRYMQQSLFPQIFGSSYTKFPQNFLFPLFFLHTFFFLFIRLPLFSLHSRRFSLSPHHISSLPQLLPLVATPSHHPNSHCPSHRSTLAWLGKKHVYIHIYITNKPSLSPSLGSTILLGSTITKACNTIRNLGLGDVFKMSLKTQKTLLWFTMMVFFFFWRRSKTLQ